MHSHLKVNTAFLKLAKHIHLIMTFKASLEKFTYTYTLFRAADIKILCKSSL